MQNYYNLELDRKINISHCLSRKWYKSSGMIHKWQLSSLVRNSLTHMCMFRQTITYYYLQGMNCKWNHLQHITSTYNHISDKIFGQNYQRNLMDMYRSILFLLLNNNKLEQCIAFVSNATNSIQQSYNYLRMEKETDRTLH